MNDLEIFLRQGTVPVSEGKTLGVDAQGNHESLQNEGGKTVVDVRNLQHVRVYRDPQSKWNAAFPEIVCLSTGDLVTAFRQAPYPPTETAGQKTHDHGDVRARGAIIRSSDGGQTWPLDTVQVLAEPEQGVEQISVSVVSGDLLISPCSYRPSGAVWVRRSTDGGDTWDEATSMGLLPLSGAAVHAPMLELPDSTILSPHCGSVGKQHVQTVIRSSDRGQTWGNGSIIAVDPSGARVYHQTSLVRYSDGEILAAMHSMERPKSADGQEVAFPRLWLSRSRDDGYTWSRLEELPMPISGAAHHILRLRDDRLVCTWGNRFDPSIRVAMSDDRGCSWDTTRGRVLREGEHLSEHEPGPYIHRPGGPVVTPRRTDIGETCSTQLPDGRVITVYYWSDGDSDPIRYIEAAIYTI